MISPQRNHNSEPYTQIMDVTPEMAMAWLDKNEGNRPINWNFVTQLARDIKAGRFACTHQGIAFDVSGRLIDGQHRLWAILEAETPARIRVFFNEPSDHLMYIDGNHPRRAADRMTLSRTLGTVRAAELATLRAMISGMSFSSGRRTLDEEMELLAKHRTAVQFAHEHLACTRPAGIANAMTRAALARAWYSAEEPNVLVRFCEVLRTSMTVYQIDRVVVLLREQLLEIRRRRITKRDRQRQYALTSRAIAAYMDGQVLTVLRPVCGEIFLLPEEV